MTGPEWWRPEALASRKANLALRGQAIGALRRFFEAHDYVEVDTPCLQISPGMEVHLMAFATQLEDACGAPARQMYLHTSPEFAMKKLVAAGMPRIWQLARVFRNRERSATHHPEFSMLEWYRVGASLPALMDETEDLVRAVMTACGATRLTRNGQNCNAFRPWQRLSVAQAFAHYADMDILATAPDPLLPDANLLKTEATRIGISVSVSDNWEDVFFKIMMDRIEPHLGWEVPTLLHSYPVSMAALACKSALDDRVAERFELYALGVELANAFNELTDATEQRRRFVADMDMRMSLYGHRYPVDEDLLAALASGMPQVSGIALGFDRLVMLIAGAERLEDVMWAPVCP